MIISRLTKYHRAYFTSFRKFALTLLSIEQQPSNIHKKQLLQSYYNTSPPPDQKSIQSILTFVKVKPKTGLANKSITQYISSRFFPHQQNTTSDFEDLINRLQDEYDRTSDDRTVPLQNIQQLLKDLQCLEGKGSLSKKVEKIDQVVSYLSQVELKILMRIIAKNLRIGIADKSMGSYLSSILQQDEDLKRQNGQGTLINNQSYFIQPMLAKPLKSMIDIQQFCRNKGQKGLIADIKYDGQRTLISFTRGKQLFPTSRRGKSQQQVHYALFTKVHAQLINIPAINSIMIDGQILCIKQDGQPLPMNAVRTKQANMKEEVRKVVFAFDVLEYNGVSLLNCKLIDRRKLIPESEHIKQCEYTQFVYPEQKQKLLQFYNYSLSKKHQGLIIKGKQDQYFTNGTRRFWGKFKRGCKIDDGGTGLIDLDLVVMGVAYGEGKRNSVFSTFLLGAYQDKSLVPITRIGNGFSDEELGEYTKMFKDVVVNGMPDEYVMPARLSVSHFVKPNYVFQVSCQQFTRSPLYQIGYVEGVGGLSLRFPVFKRLRNDKQPKSCTVEEILQYAGEF